MNFTFRMADNFLNIILEPVFWQDTTGNFLEKKNVSQWCIDSQVCSKRIHRQKLFETKAMFWFLARILRTSSTEQSDFRCWPDTMFHLELSAVNLLIQKVKLNKFRRSLKGYTNLDAYTIRSQSDCCFEQIIFSCAPTSVLHLAPLLSLSENQFCDGRRKTTTQFHLKRYR